jgi:hypothetical protein
VKKLWPSPGERSANSCACNAFAYCCACNQSWKEGMPMAKIAVVNYSSPGHVHQLAEAVQAGAEAGGRRGAPARAARAGPRGRHPLAGRVERALRRHEGAGPGGRATTTSSGPTATRSGPRPATACRPPSSSSSSTRRGPCGRRASSPTRSSRPSPRPRTPMAARRAPSSRSTTPSTTGARSSSRPATPTRCSTRPAATPTGPRTPRVARWPRSRGTRRAAHYQGGAWPATRPSSPPSPAGTTRPPDDPGTPCP